MKNILNPIIVNSVLIKRTLLIIGKQLVLICIAISLSSIFLFIAGYDSMLVVKSLVRGITTDLSGTIRWTIPLILVGLAICLSFRAKIFNLGVDGQLYLGAIVATIIAMKMENVHPVIALVVIITFAGIAGALWVFIPAILKVKYNCDEVVSTLLLNFVAYFITDYAVLGPMRGAGTLATANTTNYIPDTTFLPKIKSLMPSSANAGIYIAIIIALIIAFMLYKTKLGYEIKIVGENPRMAQYGGISSGKIIMVVMLLSGVIAGIAGSIEILGVHHRFPMRFSSQLGFDGVLVALLANNNPVGVILSAFFFGALKNGANNIQRFSDMPSATIDIVRGIIIITISINISFDKIKKRIFKKSIFDRVSVK
jgi:simple sugar transport system permease protein